MLLSLEKNGGEYRYLCVLATKTNVPLFEIGYTILLKVNGMDRNFFLHCTHQYEAQQIRNTIPTIIQSFVKSLWHPKGVKCWRHLWEVYLYIYIS